MWLKFKDIAYTFKLAAAVAFKLNMPQRCPHLKFPTKIPPKYYQPGKYSVKTPSFTCFIYKNHSISVRKKKKEEIYEMRKELPIKLQITWFPSK